MIGRAFGFNVSRISDIQQLDKLPAILESQEPEFIVVTTSVKAIIPLVSSVSPRTDGSMIQTAFDARSPA